MNLLSGMYLSSCSFVPLWVASSKRQHSKAYLLKTRKASKDQEGILTCAIQNGCSKIGKILGKSLCRSLVLETLSCNFIKTGLHRWHFPRKIPTFVGQTILQKHLLNDWLERVFKGCLLSQIIIASAGQLSKCNRKSTVIAFRILVKSHKPIWKFTGKNLWWNSLLVRERELHHKWFPINLAKFFRNFATLKIICERLLLKE